MILYLLLPIPPQQNQVLVVLHNGLMMVTVTMKTIMKNVVGMGMIVVEMMLIQHIVLLVNACVDHPTGSMMVIESMKTIMKHVVGMGKIAVVTI